MKLCIVTPSFSGGGAERIAINLANEYTEKGYDVTLLAIRGVGPYKDQINYDVKVDFVNLDNNYKVLFYLIKYFKRRKYTHVLSVLRNTNIFVGLALWFNFKSKLIFREANELKELDIINGFLRFKIILRMQLAYLRSDMVIANSFKTEQDLINFKVVSSKKITVIHNPVLPIDYIDRLNKFIDFNFNSNFYYFINVGRLHYQKNQSLLINSFSKVVEKKPQARLIILGDGIEKNNLQNLIEKLKLTEKIFLITFQNNPFPFYRHANCLVLSSHWEGFGNVIVEALAAGTPVISTDCGGPKDILQNGKYGVLVEKDNTVALADAMVNIIEGKPNFSSDMLIERAQEFTIKNKSQEYMELIQS